jgi:hypothetical protein
MTPKEKANELVLKFFDLLPSVNIEVAKECAALAVKEILLEGATQYGKYAVDFGREEYFQEVLNEIENL